MFSSLRLGFSICEHLCPQGYLETFGAKKACWTEMPAEDIKGNSSVGSKILHNA